MDFTDEEDYADCLASDCPICEYQRGRRKGIIIGAIVTIPIIFIAYIISQGIMYWK